MIVGTQTESRQERGNEVRHQGEHAQGGRHSDVRNRSRLVAVRGVGDVEGQGRGRVLRDAVHEQPLPPARRHEPVRGGQRHQHEGDDDEPADEGDHLERASDGDGLYGRHGGCHGEAGGSSRPQIFQLFSRRIKKLAFQ